jgi:hypothetical protein
LMPAYLSGIIWTSRYFTSRWIKYQLVFSIAVHAAIAIEILFYPIIIRSDDTWVGWKVLADKMRTLQQSRPNDFIFSSDEYKTAAAMNFYLPEMVYSQNIIGKSALQFDYIGSDLNQLNGRNAIFINSNPDFVNDSTEQNPPLLFNYFDSVHAISPLLIKNAGKTIRKFSIYECFNYQYKGKANNRSALYTSHPHL